MFTFHKDPITTLKQDVANIIKLAQALKQATKKHKNEVNRPDMAITLLDKILVEANYLGDCIDEEQQLVENKNISLKKVKRSFENNEDNAHILVAEKKIRDQIVRHLDKIIDSYSSLKDCFEDKEFEGILHHISFVLNKTTKDWNKVEAIIKKHSLTQ